MSSSEQPEPAVLAALVRLGLAPAGRPVPMQRLTGGVSSDIWRVDLPSGPICVKRALAQLRVAADWWAPVERNGFEADWLRTAGAAVPEAVPEVLGQDAAAGLLAMAYLPPERYPVWKAMLRDGRADPRDARALAARLGRIHAATAGDPRVSDRFRTDAIFHAIRLEPYLLATARAHPDLAAVLERLATVTAQSKHCLVHGDVSPKNILIGPRGPVFLDAECAWYGDPAFDIAFCLNHLLLKCLWNPGASPAFLACFDAFVETYLPLVAWEAPDAVEARAAALLPGLFLARVDGKSPAEYLTAEPDKALVRVTARALLREPPRRLGEVRRAWADALRRRESP